MKKSKTIAIDVEGFAEELSNPGEKEAYWQEDKLWAIGCYEFSNKEALKAARFIARWNGYELVKKKEKK